MQKNVGGMDKYARIVIGVILIALAATHTVGWWGWLGVIPLATGLVGRCGLYSLIGVNTCNADGSGKACCK